MTCYSGIDLHSTNSVVVVSDETDRVLYQRRLPNDLLRRFWRRWQPYREELAGVVVESTYNWYWLVDGLQAAGYRVHLANTAAMKRYEGIKHSGDESDAAYLAHLLRLGILPTRLYLPAGGARGARSGAKAPAAGEHPQRPGALGGEYPGATDRGRMRSNAVKRLTARRVAGTGFCPRM